MFETATLSYGPPTKRVWTTAMGFTGQAVLIGCAVLAPMISPQTLGRAFLVTTLVTPGAPPRPSPPPDNNIAERPSRTATTQLRRGAVIAPIRIPPVAAILVDDPNDFVASRTGVTTGVLGSFGDGTPDRVSTLLNDVIRVVPVIHAAEPVEHVAPKPVPVTVKPPRITQLRMATPIHKVEPVYPVIARQARVSGTVELLGVLGTDGRIHELKVLRGHPLLVNAALEAVRQWVFEPTMLNGQAVEVAAPITVNFVLNL